MRIEDLNTKVVEYMGGEPMGKKIEPLEPDPVLELYKKDVDRTLIRENLRLTVDERFERLLQLIRFAEELRRAGKQQSQLND